MISEGLKSYFPVGVGHATHAMPMHMASVV